MVVKILFVCSVTYHLSLTSFVSAHGLIPEVYGTIASNGISNLNHNAVRKIIERFKGQNFLLSPFTVYQSLCLLTNGAIDQTLDQLLTLLNVTNTSEMNLGIKSVRDELFETRGDPSKIDFVGTLWHAFYIDLNTDFVTETVEPFYAEMIIKHGSTYSTPYRDKKELNALVRKQTSDRVPILFPEGSLSFADRLAFADAMYVKPRIEFPCEARKIQFWKSHDKYYTVPLPAVEIRGKVSIHYHQETGVDVFTLPFMSGAYKVIFVKSSEPIDLFLSRITGDNAKQILINPNPNYYDKVVIPQFKLNLPMNIKTLLQDLNFTDILNQGKANLSKLSSDKAWLTAFKHRSIFSFNDEGCNASFINDLNDGHPLFFEWEFAFFVVESHFFTILLSGKVTDPREPVKPTPRPGTLGTTTPQFILVPDLSPTTSSPPADINSTTTSFTPIELAKESSPSEPSAITEKTETPRTISTSITATTISSDNNYRRYQPTMSTKTMSPDNTDASSPVDTTASITDLSKTDESGEVLTKEPIATTEVICPHICPRSSGSTLIDSMMTRFFSFIVNFINSVTLYIT